MYRIFDGLSIEETDKLKKTLPRAASFKKGDELYKNGYVALIKSGNATVRRIGASGQVLTVRIVGSGELFGAASIFGEWKKGASSIIANGSGEIIYISEKDFSKILLDFPVVSINYIRYLTERIRFLNKRIDAFSAGSTEQRLYEYLTNQKNRDNAVDLQMSMTKLASVLNVGRTSLYRDMDSLEQKGLIKREKKIIYIY